MGYFYTHIQDAKKQRTKNKYLNINEFFFFARVRQQKRKIIMTFWHLWVKFIFIYGLAHYFSFYRTDVSVILNR